MSDRVGVINTNNECGLKSAFLNVAGIFLVSRVGIFVVAYLSSLVILKDKFFGNPQNFIDYFHRWDAGWYMSIVQNGYEFIPGQESRAGFFPLYPLLVKIFSYLFVDVKLTGMVISNVALLFAAIYLYRIVALEMDDRDIAWKAVFYMLISPLSFFYSTFYTEALFICMVVLACYYARKRNWLIASVAGFFASLTKILGVLVVIPIAIEYFNLELYSPDLIRMNFHKLKQIRKDFLYVLIVPLAVVCYMIYLQFAMGDALAFVHAQSAWQRKFVLFTRTLSHIKDFPPFYRHIFWAAVVVAVVSIGYLAYRRVRPSYVVYAAVFLFMILSSNNPECLPRYISAIFPIYIGIGLIGGRGRLWHETISIFFVSFLTLFTILFVNGYWFT